MTWLDEIKWTDEGLVPVIAQESGTGRVVMFAWMNREALEKSVAEGRAIYWSRSRRRLWPKGEESGHVQWIRSVRLDCDGDVLLLEIEQVGGVACHTGRHSCFYRELRGDRWEGVDPVLKDPKQVYKQS